MTAAVEVDAIRACTDGAGWLVLASQVVVSTAEKFGALDASIKAEVLGDLEMFPIVEKALLGRGDVGSSNDGDDNGRCLVYHPLLCLRERAGGVVEHNAWI